MSEQIIALQCPQCGNTNNIAERELGFGVEFKCAICHTTAVLIIDHQLYRPKESDLICITCGRVAAAGSRFCQCGASLVKDCINCGEEFPIHHSVCDHCGWVQTVPLNSQEGLMMQLQRIVRGYDSKDRALQLRLKKQLQKMGARTVPILMDALRAQDGRIRINTCHALSDLGTLASPAAPILIEMFANGNTFERYYAGEALTNIGSAAAPALPHLVNILKTGGMVGMACQVLGAIGEGAAPAVPTLLNILRTGSSEDRIIAADALEKIGAAAVPGLVYLQTAADDADRQMIDTILQEMGSQGLAGYIHVLHNGNSAAKIKACEALALIGSQAAEAIPALLPLIETGSSEERIAACRVLLVNSHAAGEALPVMIKAVSHYQSPAEAAALCDVLSRFGKQAAPAIPALIEMLKCEGEERFAAWNTLVAIGQPAAEELRALTGFFSGTPNDAKLLARRAIQRIELRGR